MLVRRSSCSTLWVGAIKKALLFSRCLTRPFPGGSSQFLCCEGISQLLTTRLLLFYGRKCSKNVAIQVFWCCMTHNTHQSVLQSMLHRFSAAVFSFSFLISLAGWLLTTGLYSNNLWMNNFTCTAMLSRQLHFFFSVENRIWWVLLRVARFQLIPKQPIVHSHTFLLPSASTNYHFCLTAVII